ncbi:MAG: hypothetical protein AB7S26_29380 [Sandaracinaceae bacterium]
MGRLTSVCALGLLTLVGCDRLEWVGGTDPAPPSTAPEARPAPAPRPAPEPEPTPPPMVEPIAFYENGSTDRQVDAATARQDGLLVLDLGESWTPYLFTEQSEGDPEPIAHAYRGTYLALARGEFPDDHHGARAERDKYLELFGIPPTLGLLRERFRRVRDLECREGLDLEPIRSFDGFIRYENNRVARNEARNYAVLRNQVASYVERQHVASDAELDLDRLEERERRNVTQFREQRPRVATIDAVQARLACEGYFEGKGEYIHGAMDWATHEALAEFERRHRVYGWGYIGLETLERLEDTPMELERQAVIRILTERAMHALGAIEDGSAQIDEDTVPTFVGADGQTHEIPNLEAELRERIVTAFGLDTPEATLDFLEGLGELAPGEERKVAIVSPAMPEYYGDDMDLSVVIDRGDVWYEFPYDEQGRERSQPMARRPRLNLYVTYEGQRIRLARYGTTIGGWRSEQVEGRLAWRYKNSPPGPRVWSQIVSAPVWMPPDSTPSRDLVHRVPGRGGADAYRVNYHETGPSYASAYGLVAAYHRMYDQREDGSYQLRGDEGIRTHGSVDYMSIMRRHSHGCHRLHNHIAVRMMSFVLHHREHRRVGHQATAFHRQIEHEGFTYSLDIERGGYVFELARPIEVEVLEGRIRGDRATPIEEALPRYDEEVGAYVNAEGQPVTVSRMGVVTPIEPAPETPDPATGELAALPGIVDPYAVED